LTLLHRITYDCINVPQLDLYFFTPVPAQLKDVQVPVPVRNRPDPQHGCADPAPIQYGSSPVVKLDLYIWSTDPDPQHGGEDPVPVLYESTSVLHGYADPVMLHYDSSLKLDVYIWSIDPEPQQGGADPVPVQLDLHNRSIGPVQYGSSPVLNLDFYVVSPVPVHHKVVPVPVLARNNPDTQHGGADPAPLLYRSTPILVIIPVPVQHKKTSVLILKMNLHSYFFIIDNDLGKMTYIKCVFFVCNDMVNMTINKHVFLTCTDMSDEKQLPHYNSPRVDAMLRDEEGEETMEAGDGPPGGPRSPPRTLPRIYYNIRNARTATCTVRSLHGCAVSTDTIGSFEINDSIERASLANYRYSFLKRQNISTTLSLDTLVCNACTHGTLTELVESFLEATKGYIVPAGSVVVLTSVSRLATVGAAQYINEFVSLRNRLLGAFQDGLQDGLLVVHGFPIPLCGINDKACIRALTDTIGWLTQVSVHNNRDVVATRNLFKKLVLEAGSPEAPANTGSSETPVSSDTGTHAAPDEFRFELPNDLEGKTKGIFLSAPAFVPEKIEPLSVTIESELLNEAGGRAGLSLMTQSPSGTCQPEPELEEEANSPTEVRLRKGGSQWRARGGHRGGRMGRGGRYRPY
jgi:hypothetical protein